MQQNTVYVWDPLVRLFHWTLVLSFTIAYLTGEEENLWHIYSGYVVLGLILFRFVWGFVGTPHARFRDFIYPPREVSAYLKGVFTHRAKRYIGHNPAGGWMILLLLTTLLVVSFSGLKVYAIEEGRGPLAGVSTELTAIGIVHASEDEDEDEEREEREHGDEGAEEFWEEIHEASANFMLLLILLHVTGVFTSSLVHRENLVKAMITGRKQAPESTE